MGYTWQQCADTLMISRTTLWRRAQELGIATQHTTSASISDEQLDAVVKMMYLESPNNGIVMVEEPKYFCSTMKSAGESSLCLPNCCPKQIFIYCWSPRLQCTIF